MTGENRLNGDITLTGHERLGSYGVGMTLPPVSYKRHRFPPQIIAHAVWLYFRCCHGNCFLESAFVFASSTSKIRRTLRRPNATPPRRSDDGGGWRRLTDRSGWERRGCGRRRRLGRSVGGRTTSGSPASFSLVFGSGRGNSRRDCSNPCESDARRQA